MKNKFTLVLCFTTVMCLHASFFITMKKTEDSIVMPKQNIFKISFKTNHLEEKKHIKEEIKKEHSAKLLKQKKVSKKKLVKNAKRKVIKNIKKDFEVKKTNKAPHKKKIVTKTLKKINKQIIEEKTVKNLLQKTTKKEILSSNEKKKIKENYLSKIQEKIEKNKQYPKKARRLQQEGTVVVEFNIHKNGSIHSLYLKTKSSYKRLNKAALLTIQQIIKFEPIPKALNKKTLKITIPISFIIKNS